MTMPLSLSHGELADALNVHPATLRRMALARRALVAPPLG